MKMKREIKALRSWCGQSREGLGVKEAFKSNQSCLFFESRRLKSNTVELLITFLN